MDAPVVHVAIRVTDLDATLAFYRDGLDMTVAHRWTGEDGTEYVYLRGAGGAEIQCTHDPSGPADVDTSGFEHVAVRVADADAALERVVAATDCPVTMDPKTVEEAGVRAAFVADPDGHEVELLEPLDDDGPW